MRVLALTHRTPFPPDKGDKIRTHHLLTRLAKRCEVHLMAFAEPPSDLAHMARLRRHFASVTLEPLDLRWNVILVALEIDQPVMLLVATALMPGRDATHIITATIAGLLFQQRRIGPTLV